MNPVYVKMLQWALCSLFGTRKGKGITEALTTGPFAELLKNENALSVNTLFGVAAAVFKQNEKQIRDNDTGNER